MNELERHLLTRCYDDGERIEELLNTRYNMNGDQKPTIMFTGVATMAPKKDESPSLLKSSLNKRRAATTRRLVKKYILLTITKQKLLAQTHRKEITPEVLRSHRIPLIEDFLPMNRLWQSYAWGLIHAGSVTSTVVLPKLALADYNGCLLTVTKAKNPQLVGMRGIVVWDSQHSFVMVVPRGPDARPWSSEQESFTPLELIGGLRMVPKKGTIFEFDVAEPEGAGTLDDAYGFALIGSRFEVRLIERLGKKFKAHSVDDL